MNNDNHSNGPQLLVVGDLYVPGRTSWPEAAEYNYTRAGHDLRLFFAEPSISEVLAARSAKIRLALLVEPPLIVLAYKIPGLADWSDAPYTWHLVPPEHRAIPEVATGEQRAWLNVTLVDASTGILKALRAVTLTPLATQLLHAAIAAQAAQPWDLAAYDAALANLYARHASSEDIAKAAQALITGGN